MKNSVVAVLALAAGSLAQADIIASWSMPTAIPAATTGTSFNYGAADAGALTTGSMLSGSHALAATTWSSPSGNGSTYSLSSNNWSVGDYYQIAVSTANYSGISISWDQTRSSTGPSNFSLTMSTDGGANWSTLVSGYSVIQAGLSGTNTLAWSVANGVQAAFNTTGAAGSGADNKSTVLFRLVNNSTVATGGTNRIDNIVVSGTQVPAPGALALVGLGGLIAGRRRR